MYKINYDNTGAINGVVYVLNNTFIPFDLTNTDYQAYLQWLSEGNTPTPADVPV